MGGGAAEAVVTSRNRIVAGGSVRVGGDEMNDAVAQYVLRQYRLRIASQEAERLRECIEADPKHVEVAVRGMDLYLQRPVELKLPTTELSAAMEPCLSKIVSMVVEMITHLPVELAGDLIDSGIMLTGGGATQKALQTYLREATQLPVSLHHTPRQAVILGAGQLLKSSPRDDFCRL
jgi:rod shape-determining protein MreB